MTVDPSVFGAAVFDWNFLSRLFSIVIIDLILAGDNAVVIAMAVRSLPKEQRMKGVIFGSAAAVLLRVALTFFVARMLTMSYVKLAGGLVITWIAVKLFVEDESAEAGGKETVSLWHAVRLIMIADITMALDNMLAVGAASQGNFFLLLFGLGLSIPFVVFTSKLLSDLIERYPVLIYIGAAILGKVGGEMIMTDPVMTGLVHPGKAVIYLAEGIFAVGVIAAGHLRMRAVITRE
jgi:YjbE family integral membrane protein